MPDWDWLFRNTGRPRPQITVVRGNVNDFFETLELVAGYDNVPYVQVRQVTTETRADQLKPDIEAFELVHTMVRNEYPLLRDFQGGAEYLIYDKPVRFWRPNATSVNSLNYCTDGTVCGHFLVEDFLQAKSVAYR